MPTFTLDSSALGASTQFVYAETPIAERGRSIQLSWSVSGANQDMELFGYSIRFAPAEFEAKD